MGSDHESARLSRLASASTRPMQPAIPRCWEPRDLRHRITTDTYEKSNPAFFRLAHVPTKGLRPDPEGLGYDTRVDFPDARVSEEDFLRVVSDSDKTHVACFVIGASGSGKSELLRWLEFHWPQGTSDRLVAIRKSDRLIERLQNLSEGLGAVDEAARFQSQLSYPDSEARLQGVRMLLANGLLKRRTDQIADTRFCDEYMPTELLQAPPIRDGHWKGLDRVVAALEGGGGSETLTIADVVELVVHCQGREAGFTARSPAKKLIKRCSGDLAVWQNLGGTLQQAPNVEEEFRRQLVAAGTPCVAGFEEPGHLLPLLRVLNARLPEAVAPVYGLTADLHDIVTKVRKRLLMEDEGSRLVLLFEDLSQFEAIGLDRAVCHVMEDTHDKYPEMAPVVVIAAITSYFRQTKIGTLDTLRTRLSHVLLLSEDASDSDRRTMFSDEASRHEFVARYLNLARLKPTHIAQLGESGVSGPFVSACDGCDQVERCHATFGHVDILDDETPHAVGLFPFDAHSLGQLVARAGTDPNPATPREVIDKIVRPVLSQFDQGHPIALSHPGLKPTTLYGLVEEYWEDLLIQFPQESPLRRRWELLAQWYGYPHIYREEGFASLNPDLTEALGMPWRFGEPGVHPGTTGSPPVAPPTPPDDSADDAPVSLEETFDTLLSQLSAQLRLLREQQDEERPDLHREVHARLAKALFDKAHNHLTLEIPQRLFSSAFSTLSLGPAQKGTVFQLPREDWVIAGLVGAANVFSAEIFPDVPGALRHRPRPRHYISIARFRERIRPFALEHATAVNRGSWVDGETPGTQLLTLALWYEWLTGGLDPRVPLLDQVQHVLDALHTDTWTPPRARSESCNELQELLRRLVTHSEAKKTAQGWLAKRAPEATKVLGYDIPICLGAVRKAREGDPPKLHIPGVTSKVWSAPTWPKFLEEALKPTRSPLRILPAQALEDDRTTMEVALGRLNALELFAEIPEILPDLERSLDYMSRHVPRLSPSGHVASAEIKKFLDALNELRELNLLENPSGPTWETVHQRLEDCFPTQQAFGEVLSTHYQAIALADRALASGHAALQQLWAAIEHLPHKASALDPEDIHQRGRDLKQLAEDLLSAPERKPIQAPAAEVVE